MRQGRFRRRQLDWRRQLSWRILIALIVLGVLSGAGGASANGLPVDIFLSYLPKESNWGPQDAQGRAHVAVADGSISLEVLGLQQLQDQHYTIWLESRGQREVYAVGQFNADAQGKAHFEAELDVPNQEYRMLFLSVEQGALGRLETRPDARRSLAGMFPNKVITPTPLARPGIAGSLATPIPAASDAAVVVGQSTVTAGGAPVAGQPLSRPPYLPVTGISRPSRNAFVFVLALAVLLTTAGLGKLEAQHFGPAQRRQR